MGQFSALLGARELGIRQGVINTSSKIIICPSLHFGGKESVVEYFMNIFSPSLILGGGGKVCVWIIICQTNQFSALPLRFLLNSKFWSIELF